MLPAVSSDWNLTEIGQQLTDPTLAPATERAWLAGFFDGEGHTGALKSYSRSDPDLYSTTLRVTVAQAHDYESLDRLYSIVGERGRFYGPYAKKGYEKKKTWTAHGDEARHVLWLMWPYLGEIKKQQALAAIEEADHGLGSPERLQERKRIKAHRTRIRTWNRWVDRGTCTRGHTLAPGTWWWRGDHGGLFCRLCRREFARDRKQRG